MEAVMATAIISDQKENAFADVKLVLSSSVTP